MNKFAHQMSRTGATVRQDRAQAAANMAEIEQQALVNDLVRRKLELQNKLGDLTDFGADNTYSLRGIN